jgi:hypothetical protein
MRQLAPYNDDPWLLGYFIGNEPPWPGRERQCGDLVSPWGCCHHGWLPPAPSL